MNTLTEISPELIRQNWSNYKDDIYYSLYESLWDDLINKFKIDKQDVYLSILKKFINKEEILFKKPLLNRIHIIQIDEKTLVLKGLDGEERKHIHHLCDKIGLHHDTKKQSKKKFLYIYKPEEWLWEYTIRNPYSKDDEYYAKRELESQKRKQQLKDKLSETYCCICDKNALQTDLYCSVYIDGLYCNDCLDNTSDECGGYLSDHKFEPWR